MARRVANKAKSIQISSGDSSALEGELIPAAEAAALRTIRAALPAKFAAQIGKGRPRGAKNKATRKLQEIMHNVYNGIGGDAAFITWARANRTDFYKLFAKQLPLDARRNPNDASIHIHISKEDSEV